MSKRVKSRDDDEEKEEEEPIETKAKPSSKGGLNYYAIGFLLLFAIPAIATFGSAVST